MRLHLSPPRKAGFYWFKEEDEEWEVVRVYPKPDCCMTVIGGVDPVKFSDLSNDCAWIGPLPVPEIVNE